MIFPLQERQQGNEQLFAPNTAKKIAERIQTFFDSLPEDRIWRTPSYEYDGAEKFVFNINQSRQADHLKIIMHRRKKGPYAIRSIKIERSRGVGGNADLRDSQIVDLYIREHMPMRRVFLGIPIPGTKVERDVLKVGLACDIREQMNGFARNEEELWSSTGHNNSKLVNSDQLLALVDNILAEALTSATEKA